MNIWNRSNSVNDDVAQQLEQFYDREVKNAVFMSKQKAMIEVLKFGTPEQFTVAIKF